MTCVVINQMILPDSTVIELILGNIDADETLKRSP